MEIIDFKIPCPNNAIRIIEVLNGYEPNKSIGLFVGGCVRDSILGLKPKDWDITTNINPDNVVTLIKSKIPQAVVFDDDSRFGIVRVKIDGEEYEIATMRSDGEYLDNRRPGSVFFGDIIDDYKRRDFTINALYYNPIDHVVIDYVGGVKDIEDKVLRTVGNPLDRFSEDRLRILRAIRFASRFGLKLDIDLKGALEIINGDLSGVSNERIYSELVNGFKTAKKKSSFVSKLHTYNLLSNHIGILIDSPYSYSSYADNSKTFIEYITNIIDKNISFKIVENKLNEICYSREDIKIVKLNFIINDFLKSPPIDYYGFRKALKVYVDGMGINDLALLINRLSFSTGVTKLIIKMLNLKDEYTSEYVMELNPTLKGKDLGELIRIMNNKHFAECLN